MNKKRKKLKKQDILLNVLIKSKNMYGNNVKKINKEIIPFIYGIRYNYSIIDIYKVSLYIKRIFYLLKYLFYNNKKILIIGNSIDINFLLNKKYIKNNKNIYFLNNKYINGFITNKNFLLKNKIYLILILNNNNIFLNKDLFCCNVPIISVINTEQKIKNINYPIICNLKNIKSIYTLMFLFRKIFN